MGARCCKNVEEYVRQRDSSSVSTSQTARLVARNASGSTAASFTSPPTMSDDEAYVNKIANYTHSSRSAQSPSDQTTHNSLSRRLKQRLTFRKRPTRSHNQTSGLKKCREADTQYGKYGFNSDMKTECLEMVSSSETLYGTTKDPNKASSLRGDDSPNKKKRTSHDSMVSALYAVSYDPITSEKFQDSVNSEIICTQSTDNLVSQHPVKTSGNRSKNVSNKLPFTKIHTETKHLDNSLIAQSNNVSQEIKSDSSSRVRDNGFHRAPLPKHLNSQELVSSGKTEVEDATSATSAVIPNNRLTKEPPPFPTMDTIETINTSNNGNQRGSKAPDIESDSLK